MIFVQMLMFGVVQTASVTTVSARSWVLRACACEAGAAGGTRQHAALAALLAALTHTPHHPEQVPCHLLLS